MNSTIPQEIVIQIFTWLPVKSLMRFKCVDKFLNFVVSESYFMDIHTSHSMTRQRYLLDVREFYYTADQQQEDVKTSAFGTVQNQRFVKLPFYIPVRYSLNCVNGLFCIWDLSVQPAAILNPSTGDIKFLPNLDDDLCRLYYWLGFEPEENKYKVLSTRNNVSELYLKHWVFTLGIDESWREIQSISNPIMSKRGVCINGVIYRFVSHDGLAIDAFDVKTETSKLIALRNASKWWNYELVEVKGQLAIINYEKWSWEYIQLRVLGQIQNEQEWESHIIHFPSMWKDIAHEVIPTAILSCASCDGQILFILNSKSSTLCSCYDVTRRSWTKLEIKGLPMNHHIRGIYSYVERLVM